METVYCFQDHCYDIKKKINEIVFNGSHTQKKICLVLNMHSLLIINEQMDLVPSFTCSAFLQVK